MPTHLPYGVDQNFHASQGGEAHYDSPPHMVEELVYSGNHNQPSSASASTWTQIPPSNASFPSHSFAPGAHNTAGWSYAPDYHIHSTSHSLPDTFHGPYPAPSAHATEHRPLGNTLYPSPTLPYSQTDHALAQQNLNSAEPPQISSEPSQVHEYVQSEQAPAVYQQLPAAPGQEVLLPDHQANDTAFPAVDAMGHWCYGFPEFGCPGTGNICLAVLSAFMQKNPGYLSPEQIGNTILSSITPGVNEGRSNVTPTQPQGSISSSATVSGSSTYPSPSGSLDAVLPPYRLPQSNLSPNGSIPFSATASGSSTYPSPGGSLDTVLPPYQLPQANPSPQIPYASPSGSLDAGLPRFVNSDHVHPSEQGPIHWGPSSSSLSRAVGSTSTSLSYASPSASLHAGLPSFEANVAHTQPSLQEPIYRGTTPFLASAVTTLPTSSESFHAGLPIEISQTNIAYTNPYPQGPIYWVPTTSNQANVSYTNPSPRGSTYRRTTSYHPNSGLPPSSSGSSIPLPQFVPESSTMSASNSSLASGQLFDHQPEHGQGMQPMPWRNGPINWNGTPSNQRRYICRICMLLHRYSKPLSRKDALKRHILLVHFSFRHLVKDRDLNILESIPVDRSLQPDPLPLLIKCLQLQAQVKQQGEVIKPQNDLSWIYPQFAGMF